VNHFVTGANSGEKLSSNMFAARNSWPQLIATCAVWNLL